jgi:hypothetical protein
MSTSRYSVHLCVMLLLLSPHLVIRALAAQPSDVSSVRRASQDLLTFLRSAPEHDLDPGSASLWQRKKKLRRAVSSAGEPGLVAMEEVGAPLLRASLHHTSRYSHFWACYEQRTDK